MTILPLFVCATIAATAYPLMRNRLRLWRIRHRGGHLVLAGDAALLPIVAGEARAGNPAIVLANGADGRWRRHVHRAGSPHVRADAPGGMARYLRKARMILLAGPDDNENIASATAILAPPAQAIVRDLPLPMIVRVDDASRHSAIEQALARPQSSRDPILMRLVSLPAMIGRSLLRARIVDRVERIGTGERLVVVIGFTPAIEHYALDGLVGGRFGDGRDLRIVVVDPRGGARARFVARWPAIERLRAPTFIVADVADPVTVASVIASIGAEQGAPAAVIVDVGAEQASLAVLAAVDAVFRSRGDVAPAYAVHATAAALSLIKIAALPFGGGDIAAHGELLLDEQQEETARAVHDFYLEGRLDAGEALGSRPVVNGWDALSEGRRDDYRLQVDCHALRLRDIGARIVPGRGPSFAFEPDELAMLVDAEHERWMAARRLAGWEWGAVRDEAGRRHPHLLPVRDLPAAAIAREHEQIGIVTRLLGRSGRHAVRDLRVLIAPDFIGDAVAEAAALALAYPDRQLVFMGDLAISSIQATLHAIQAAGHVVQIALDRHIDALIAELSPEQAARCRLLVARADRIVVPDQIGGGQAALAARAHHRLAGASGRASRPHHAARVFA